MKNYNYIIFNKTIGKFIENTKYEIISQEKIEGIEKYIILNPDSPKNKNYCTTVDIKNKNIKEVKFF